METETPRYKCTQEGTRSIQGLRDETQKKKSRALCGVWLTGTPRATPAGEASRWEDGQDCPQEDAERVCSVSLGWRTKEGDLEGGSSRGQQGQASFLSKQAAEKPAAYPPVAHTHSQGQTHSPLSSTQSPNLTLCCA